MLIRIFAILIFGYLSIATNAQEEGYLITFTDKNNNPYSVDKPLEFLSQRAIERRVKQLINITEQDLPVTPAYTDSLKKFGIDVRHTSKWFNSAIAFSGDQMLMDTLTQLSFIQSVEKTKPLVRIKSKVNKFENSFITEGSESLENYGDAWDQISTVNGHLLHQLGFTGEGIHIAIIDAGFYGVDSLPVFQHLWNNNQILGTKDFVNSSSDIFEEHEHGMYVLSIVGGKQEGVFLGTAPGASFWLLRTEDSDTETPIEPDYWICAVEFADSAGVDIINTSLGYYEFDPPSQSYTYDDMNGSTRISQASEIAASKGMLIVTSAGNEGNKTWKYITAPADAKNNIAIGAISADSTLAYFSSLGPSSDSRVKPEVCAMGELSAIQSSLGTIIKGNGTSFSAPVITGMAACLWQSDLNKQAFEIRQLIIESSNQFQTPDNELGYGIPDFEKAYNLNATKVEILNQGWCISPNPFTNKLTIKSKNQLLNKDVKITVYDISGNVLFHKKASGNTITIDELSSFSDGVYIIIIENNNLRQQIKTTKYH